MPADLLLIVEGPRDEAVLRTLIEKRAGELDMREVSLEFRRRSGAVYTEGIEVAAIERRNFRKVILLWDHTDSRYADETPQRAQGIVQRELNRRTLKNCSKAIAVDPELEVWLCQDWSAVARVLGVGETEIHKQLEEWTRNLRRESEENLKDLLKQRQVDVIKDSPLEVAHKLPKEAVEFLCRRARKKPDSKLWSEIAACADVNSWKRCPSFQWLCRQLRRWFPLRSER
jgi:hypothetical protein